MIEIERKHGSISVSRQSEVYQIGMCKGLKIISNKYIRIYYIIRINVQPRISLINRNHKKTI